MANLQFRQHELMACATCGLEWFGVGGEPAARQHALTTGHQVQIEYRVRETLNAVNQAGAPNYIEPLEPLTTNELRKSRKAAMARLEAAGVQA